jgi:hypothetical protein
MWAIFSNLGYELFRGDLTGYQIRELFLTKFRGLCELQVYLKSLPVEGPAE